MKRKMIILLAAVVILICSPVVMTQQDAVPEPATPAEAVTQPQDSSATSKDVPTKEKSSITKAKTDSPFHFGLGIGNEIINGVPYISIAMQPDLAFGKFGVGLDVTLRFDGTGSLYKPDWENWKNIISKINYIRWDEKGAPLFFKIGLLDDVYLGHGGIFYRYSNKLFLPAVRRIGFQFDAKLSRFGWELFDDDIIDNRIFGGRFYYNPFAGVPLFKKLALGFSGAADIKLDTSVTNSRSKNVVLAGVDVDIPVIQFGKIFSFLVFTDFVKNFHFTEMNGTGVTPGFIMTILSFDFRGEYHFYQPNFDGPYFNAFYDLERNTKLYRLSKMTNATQGWAIKMAKDFWGFVSFDLDLGANTDMNPDLHFEVVMKKKIMDKYKVNLFYDKTDIPDMKDLAKVNAINSKMTVEAVYAIASTVDLIFLWQKSFIETPTGIQSQINYMIQTKLNF